MFKRTHTCGELSVANQDQHVCLSGWVNSWRNHGGVIFIDLRDRYGITQVVFNAEIDSTVYDQAGKLRNEYVLSVKGTVSLRPKGTINDAIATGEIELMAEELQVLNISKIETSKRC